MWKSPRRRCSHRCFTAKNAKNAMNSAKDITLLTHPIKASFHQANDAMGRCHDRPRTTISFNPDTMCRHSDPTLCDGLSDRSGLCVSNSSLKAHPLTRDVARLRGGDLLSGWTLKGRQDARPHNHRSDYCRGMLPACPFWSSCPIVRPSSHHWIDAGFFQL